MIPVRRSRHTQYKLCGARPSTRGARGHVLAEGRQRCRPPSRAFSLAWQQLVPLWCALPFAKDGTLAKLQKSQPSLHSGLSCAVNVRPCFGRRSTATVSTPSPAPGSHTMLRWSSAVIRHQFIVIIQKKQNLFNMVSKILINL